MTLSVKLRIFRYPSLPLLAASGWGAAPLHAGDILRGGAPAVARPADAAARAAVASQQEALARRQDALARTARALESVRNMQAQARAAALRSMTSAGADPNHPGQLLPPVPDGLAAGGLQLRGVPIGAAAPVERRTPDRTEVTVKQTAQQALLDWESFNLGRGTHLHFDQSAAGADAAQWIAFNRVSDPSRRPSQILGRITAPGQVFVVNQNGIIFGGSSQVNARSFTASSLPLNDNLVQRGLLNNPDSQFLFTALPVPAGSRGTPAFTPPDSFLPGNRRGDLTVQPGALLESTPGSDGDGGRILLAAPNVLNAGTLTARNGQVIMAAGQELGLSAHDAADATLRGLDVHVGRTGSDGLVRNTGLIEVPRGSAWLAGRDTRHEGVIESSTTTARNGRIDLTADHDAVPNAAWDPAVPATGRPFLSRATGPVTLGAGSVMRILPELGNEETAVGSSLALRSTMVVRGLDIHMSEGASVLAPNARVSLEAGRWYYNGAPVPPVSLFTASAGSVRLDRGAFIDVSGSTGVRAPLSRVILDVVLRAGELAPVPLQRTSPVRGPVLTVDLRDRGVHRGRVWVGTPLADLTGYLGIIERTVGELTAAGGEVSLSAGGTLLMQPGAAVHADAGHITYSGGPVRTSRLWSDGHLVDLRDAIPERVYSGIYNGTADEVHPRWGITKHWAHALAPTGARIDPGWTETADAGRVTLAAPAMELRGRLTGTAVPGPRQLRAAADVSRLPAGGSLTLFFGGSDVLSNAIAATFPDPPDIVFGPSTPAATTESVRRRLVRLDPALAGPDGFASLTVRNDGGGITVPDGVALRMPVGGAVRLTGANVRVNGTVAAPAGTIALEALNFTPWEVAVIRSLPEDQRQLPPPNAGRGLVTLGPRAMLDAAGVLADDRPGFAAAFSAPLRLDGGSIRVAGYDTMLAQGSRINVMGGAHVDASGHIHQGDGGSIVLTGGQDPQLDGIVGGRFQSMAALSGWSGARGGSLAITAPLVRVGGASQPDGFRVGPEFFDAGGFSRWTLTGLPMRDDVGRLLPALVVAGGTVVAPVVRSAVLAFDGPGGTPVRREVLRDPGARPAAELNFTAAGIRDGILDVPLLRGDLVVPRGAVLAVEPGGSISLAGRTVFLDGSLTAPGGQITLTAGDSNAATVNSDVPRATLVLGPQARLGARGAVLPVPDPFGRRLGTVLPGGTVSLTGNVLAAAGAVIDVSGHAAVRDVHPAAARLLPDYATAAAAGLTQTPGALETVPLRIESPGGTVNLTGLDLLVSDASLRAFAGGPQAAGGTLTVRSGRFLPPGNLPQPTDINLTVAAGGDFLPAGFAGSGAVAAPVPASLAAGWFAADRFARGGFDNLVLGGAARLTGDLTLTARGALSVASDGIMALDGAATLTAPCVALGRALELPQRPEDRRNPFGTAFAPTTGSGTLDVHARHIDLGTLSFQNTQRVALHAPGGDLRGSGTVNLSGELLLRAGQVHPLTAAALEVFVYDRKAGDAVLPGLISIEATGTRPLPLSAGGRLAFHAAEIHQNGVLRAPFGSITLGWDGIGTAPRDFVAGGVLPPPVTTRLQLGEGSVTSVSAVDPATGRGLLLPYGASPDGVRWIDPRGLEITAGGLPERRIDLAADSVSIASGALLDLRGGGDLMAWRWVPGNGGPADILAAPGSFAILPGFDAAVSPVAPFNAAIEETNLIAALGPGYTAPGLTNGTRIRLAGSRTLAAGDYLLLPPRYALLPGGVLVTPRSDLPSGTRELPDGSSVAGGIRYEGLSRGGAPAAAAGVFDLASGTVIRQRAEYETLTGTAFLGEAAVRLGLPRPLLPPDAGRLAVKASSRMDLRGMVLAAGAAGARGALVDLGGRGALQVTDDGTGAPPGTMALSAAVLRGWRAEGLLLGGVRGAASSGIVPVEVTAGSVTLTNSREPLAAADVVLAAREAVTIGNDAVIAAAGGAPADALTFSGGAAVLRAAGATEAPVMRTGPSGASGSLTIGSGVRLTGGSLVLDAPGRVQVDAAATLAAEAWQIGSNRIAVALGGVAVPDEAGQLVLSGRVLDSLQRGSRLTLRSAATIDFHGSGTLGGNLGLLDLGGGALRSIGGGKVQLAAAEVRLGNPAASPVPAAQTGSGRLAVAADVIRLTAGNLTIAGFDGTSLTAARFLTGDDNGNFATGGDLIVQTPLVTGGAGSRRSLTSSGALALTGRGAADRTAAGLGASLALSGASASLDTTIVLPSGNLAVTARTVEVSGTIDVGGAGRYFFDAVRQADAGAIRLEATSGNVALTPSSRLLLDALPAGGHAGSLTISAPAGRFLADGTLSARGGQGGHGGSFALDAASLPATGGLTSVLGLAGINDSVTFRVRNGDVLLDGALATREFRLAADAGSVRVIGRVSASGHTGGLIRIAAHGDLDVAAGSLLDVRGALFDAAGRGGRIELSAGTLRGGTVGSGTLTLSEGARLALGVTAADAGSQALGRFTGTLQLRAPRTAAGMDLALAPIGATIDGASAITAEGWRLFDLTSTGGAITAAVQQAVRNDGTAFLGAPAQPSAGWTAIMDRLTAPQPGLRASLVILPGAEIVNRAGSLTLGTATSTTLNDWDLSGFRYGPQSAPGVLTLRASGDLVFNNTLSDGFVPFVPASNPPPENLRLWQGRLAAFNPLLPPTVQSHAYRLAAGADFAGADAAAVVRGTGSVVLGKAGFTTDEQNNTVPGGDSALTRTVVPQRWQVIRTGSGDIAVHAGSDIRFLNHFASIYTAGTPVADPTMGGTFDVPRPGQPPAGTQGLGAAQLTVLYPAQYSMAGGSVTLDAGGSIERLTRNSGGQLVADSQLQLPGNWLYRRGTVDPLTGRFAVGRVANDILSTSWWIDYSNFFQGVGTLGGGHATLTAGGSVRNVDAVAATNLRVTKGSDANPLAASQTALELGGGDVRVRAGGDIDAGIYYVERGRGTLAAGGSIVTNATRSVLSPSSIAAGQGSEWTRLPTTLFAGRASFDVSARGDVLLGPVANPFLLPSGLGNSVWYKSWQSTYGADAALRVTSLGGAVTLRTAATPFLQSAGAAEPLLQLWAVNKQMLGSDTASRARPWLRLNEAGIDELIRYRTMASLMPGTLEVAAWSGNISVAGNLTLTPAPRGTLSLLASGALEGLRPNGVVNVNGLRTTWGTATVNLSDANPADLPGRFAPLGYTTAMAQATSVRQPLFFLGLDALFAETGATGEVLQARQARHAPGLLHAGDPEPLRLHAAGGDITGLTLFAPKPARVLAARDLTDVALYLQNLAPGDTSVAAAGRDIVPANAGSPLRAAANLPGNLPNLDALPRSGDIQISGPGTLEVLAGRTIDLGTLPGNADGTGTGITSVGNARNPWLPFRGSSLVIGAGMGPVTGLTDSTLALDAFIARYVEGPQGAAWLAELDDVTGGRPFAALGEEEQARAALAVFHMALRDAGRSAAGTMTGGGYADGFAAIATLFPQPGTGDILTRGRDLRTRNGGGISILAPAGGLSLATTAIGNPLAPPGIVTESGGRISIFARDDVSVGIGRIFTLRGGDQVIWSSQGDIAAGSAPKTVQSAPPTRVLIDPQSGAVQTDLAGLATGGGIGVLTAVREVPPGSVDLIAPAGVVDAGDAGIRASGNLTIAATQVLNAGNIAVGGTSTGTPAPVVAAPNVSGLTAAGNAAGAGSAAASNATDRTAPRPSPSPEAAPETSPITVTVEGYGGSEDEEEESAEEKDRKARSEAAPPAEE